MVSPILPDSFEAMLVREGLVRPGADLSERDQARNAWHRGHLAAMARMVSDSGVELEWSADGAPGTLLDSLVQVLGLNSCVLQTIAELLDLLDEVEAEEEDQSGVSIPPPPAEGMSPGEEAAWMSRLCAAIGRADQTFPWRVGAESEDWAPDYLIGAPPPTPPLIDEA